MKKVFTLIAAAILCMSASAQTQFGFKVGFDMTNFWGEDINHGMKPSYQFGVLMEHQFNNKFAISPEVVFASQGGKCDDYTYNTNYINIPVMLKYYVTPKFSVDFGPQLGVNVYSKFSVDGIDDAVDLKDATKDIDFGLGLGGTYNLTENAFIQARYTMGLTNTFGELKLGELGTYESNAKNGNIQVAFGMKF